MYLSHDDILLFTNKPWHRFAKSQEEKLKEEVSSIERNEFLNTSVDDLCFYLAEKHRVNDVPVLKEGVADYNEVEDEISGGERGLLYGGTQPIKVRDTEIKIAIPFDGDAEFFWIRPSRYTSSTPKGTVEGSSVYLRVLYESGTSKIANGDQIKEEIGRTLDLIEESLEQLRNDASIFNTHLSTLAREFVETRRKKLLDAQSIVSSLGFKIKQREDDIRTYVAPEVRRKIAPVLPPASSEPYIPEPYLKDSDYEHILKVIHDMALVMERAPSAFVSMNEEAIRWLYLVVLNGHYEGQATGETFNYQGKTDMLVRSEGKNIFIAECKFWKGPKKHTETIDQLLSYSSWRDTKVAVIVFNRNKDFTKVLANLDETTRNHPDFKRFVEQRSETSFRYVFAHRDDPNREMVLTVIAFDVPT